MPADIVAGLPSLSTVFRTMAALNVPIAGEARNTVEFLTGAVNQTSPDDSQNSDASQKLSVPSVPIDEHGEDFNRERRKTPQSLASALTPGADEAQIIGQRTTAPSREPTTIEAQVIPSAGLQMAQGASRIVAVLRANIGAEEIDQQPPQYLEGIEGASILAIERAEPAGERSLRSDPEGAIEPDLKAQFDIEELMEKLADGLEFEFIRTYGTSGR